MHTENVSTARRLLVGLIFFMVYMGAQSLAHVTKESVVELLGATLFALTGAVFGPAIARSVERQVLRKW